MSHHNKPKINVITDKEVLHFPSFTIPNVNPYVKKIYDKIYSYLLTHNNACGLAAIQLGFPICLIGVKKYDMRPLMLINPQIKSFDILEYSVESCLSIPNKVYVIKRYTNIEVGYQNLALQTNQIKATGFISYCLQHEIDHCQGILISDKGVEESTLKNKM